MIVVAAIRGIDRIESSQPRVTEFVPNGIGGCGSA
jgi:hypothetical protein